MSGITENGFIKITENELQAELVADFKTNFGNAVTLTPQSFLGQQLAIMKRRESQLWDLLEFIYYSLFVNTATGVNLDRASFPFVRLSATKSSVQITFTGDDGTIVPVGTIITTADGVEFETTEEIELVDSSGGDAMGSANAVSILTGANQNFSIGTITELPDDITGIDSLVNNIPATGGKDIESDGEFVSRIAIESQLTKSSSVNAIRQALLNLSGVINATVSENDSDSVDVDGLLPHSIHCVVNGSASDEDIAQVIFDTKSAGIGTNGSESYVIVVGSENYPIKFSRSVVVNIYIDIQLTVNLAWKTENINIVKSRILSYIGGVDPNGVEYSGLKAGEDVLIWKISASLFNPNQSDDLGIDDVYIEASIDSDPSMAETVNIVIAPDEEAATDFSLIILTTV